MKNYVLDRDLNSYYKNIGKHVKKLREKMAISQSTLAEKINVSLPYISQIENGKTMLSVPTLIDIANALETTPDYLLFDNVLELRVLLDKEIEDIVKDLNHEQFKLMIEMMKTSKEVIIKSARISYDKFEKNNKMSER